MTQYTVVLFDQSTSTEYTRQVQASDQASAAAQAIEEILAFICEMEDTSDPDGVAKIRADLVKREPKVSQLA